jgi:hypothetical protein
VIAPVFAPEEQDVYSSELPLAERSGGAQCDRDVAPTERGSLTDTLVYYFPPLREKSFESMTTPPAPVRYFPE